MKTNLVRITMAVILATTNVGWPPSHFKNQNSEIRFDSQALAVEAEFELHPIARGRPNPFHIPKREAVTFLRRFAEAFEKSWGFWYQGRDEFAEQVSGARATLDAIFILIKKPLLADTREVLTGLLDDLAIVPVNEGDVENPFHPRLSLVGRFERELNRRILVPYAGVAIADHPKEPRKRERVSALHWNQYPTDNSAVPIILRDRSDTGQYKWLTDTVFIGLERFMDLPSNDEVQMTLSQILYEEINHALDARLLTAMSSPIEAVIPGSDLYNYIRTYPNRSLRHGLLEIIASLREFRRPQSYPDLLIRIIMIHTIAGLYQDTHYWAMNFTDQQLAKRGLHLPVGSPDEQVEYLMEVLPPSGREGLDRFAGWSEKVIRQNFNLPLEHPWIYEKLRPIVKDFYNHILYRRRLNRRSRKRQADREAS